MNLYYDSEFTGLHQTTTLISLAFVADDGREFYAEFSDYNHEQCDEWIKQNVLSHTRWLQKADAKAGCWEEGALTCSYGDREQNRQALTTWLAHYEQIEIWADCLAWDWVLFCQLFGGAFGTPQQIHYMPLDLVTLFNAKGLDPDTDRIKFAALPPKQNLQRHNALYDAHVIRTCYHKLMGATRPDHYTSTKTENLLLDYYHCTFFLPLIGLPDDLKPKGKPYLYPPGDTREGDAQAYHYFTPALRDILFARNVVNDTSPHPRPLQEWRLEEPEVHKLKLHLGNDANKDNPLLYQKGLFQSVTLYRYFNGIYLLAFQVTPEALPPLQKEQEKLKRNRVAELTANEELSAIKKEKIAKKAEDWLVKENNGVPLFRANAPATLDQAISQHPAEADIYKQLQLEAWLRFTRLARLLYPSFAEQSEESKISPLRLYQDNKEIATAFDKTAKMCIPAQSGENLSSVVRRLLELFFSQSDSERLKSELNTNKHIYDDRLYVSVAYGLTEKKLPQKQLERLFSLALYVDRHNDTWNELDAHVYTPKTIKPRIKERSMRLWEGKGGYFGYTDYSNAVLYSDSFFRDILAPTHIPRIYDRMLIQALFYQASLRLYDDDICKETDKILEEKKPNRIRQQRKAFIRFTNQYWFHNLTEQMQGKEIFKLQQDGLGLEKHYNIIKDELERTDEYLQMEHEIRISRFSNTFAIYGLVIAFLALYYAVLQLIPTYITKDIWQWMHATMSYIVVPFNMPEEVLRPIWKLFFIPGIAVVAIVVAKRTWHKWKLFLIPGRAVAAIVAAKRR